MIALGWTRSLAEGPTRAATFSEKSADLDIAGFGNCPQSNSKLCLTFFRVVPPRTEHTMTHIFMVMLTCVWVGPLNGPSYSCNEAHVRQGNLPEFNLGTVHDPKTRGIIQNMIKDPSSPMSPFNICTITAEEMMKSHFGDSDPGSDGHIRILKRYCQPEHDGPSYLIDLRTGQITLLNH
jgi:hypothetical protein